MIVFSVEVKELFIGQFRNNIRITAGLYTVDCIREQGVCDLSV